MTPSERVEATSGSGVEHSPSRNPNTTPVISNPAHLLPHLHPNLALGLALEYAYGDHQPIACFFSNILENNAVAL